MPSISSSTTRSSQAFATIMVAAVLAIPAYIINGAIIGILLAVILLARELVSIYNIRSVPLNILINAGAGSLGIIFFIQVFTLLMAMTSIL